MEAEKYLSLGSKRSSLADGDSSATSTTAAQQRHEQQQQWLLAEDSEPMQDTYSVIENFSRINNARPCLVETRAVTLGTATAASSGGAAELTADVRTAMSAGAAASLPTGAFEAVPAHATSSALACDVTVPSASTAPVNSFVHTAAKKACGRELNEGFCREESNKGFHACALGEDWWLPHSEPNESGEWEERAGVVSRVLQVLRCESLLREAQKALQSARLDFMDSEADVNTVDAKETSKQKQHPATVSVENNAGILLREGTVNATADAMKEVPMEEAAGLLHQPVHGVTAGGVEIRRNRTSHKARTVLVDGDRQGSSFEPSVPCQDSAAFSDITLSLPDLQPCHWQQVQTQELVPAFDTPNRSLARMRQQTEEETHCSGSEGARRSVWMRGEKSEADLQDDCKIRALRALIPQLLAVVPDWLDSKLDTGRRGEWLGFEKVIPSILRQRFGFTGDELRKDGPFCWKGSRRTSVTAVSPLLLYAAATQDSHPAACCTHYSEEARQGFYHTQQRRQPDEQQVLLHLETHTRQLLQQGVQPDGLSQQKLHQSHAQQLASADLLVCNEGMTLGSTQGCGRKKQLEECLHTVEAMEVDEEYREHLAENSNRRGVSDTETLESGGSRSSSKTEVAGQPMGSSTCGRQGSNTVSGESGDVADTQEDSAVVLEITSVWVNGFQESGKPYDVHVQAKIDGRVARDFYIEIKATVATHPCFVLSLQQLEFAGSQGPDNYLVLVICSIRAGSPAWMILDNVAERVAFCLNLPLPTMMDSTNQYAATTTAWSALPPDLKIRCRFQQQVNASHLAARGQLTEQSVEDILGCLLKPSSH